MVDGVLLGKRTVELGVSDRSCRTHRETPSSKVSPRDRAAITEKTRKQVSWNTLEDNPRTDTNDQSILDLRIRVLDSKDGCWSSSGK